MGIRLTHRSAVLLARLHMGFTFLRKTRGRRVARRDFVFNRNVNLCELMDLSEYIWMCVLFVYVDMRSAAIDERMCVHNDTFFLNFHGIIFFKD